jgi:hypothetical protein
MQGASVHPPLRQPCNRRWARPAPGWLRALPPSPEGLATPASRGARLPRRAAERGAEVECAPTRHAPRRSSVPRANREDCRRVYCGSVASAPSDVVRSGSKVQSDTPAMSPHQRRRRDCCLSSPAARGRSPGAARLGGRSGRPFMQREVRSSRADTRLSCTAQAAGSSFPLLSGASCLCGCWALRRWGALLRVVDGEHVVAADGCSWLGVVSVVGGLGGLGRWRGRKPAGDCFPSGGEPSERHVASA